MPVADRSLTRRVDADAPAYLIFSRESDGTEDRPRI
jgi:hypothetical protein